MFAGTGSGLGNSQMIYFWDEVKNLNIDTEPMTECAFFIHEKINWLLGAETYSEIVSRQKEYVSALELFALGTLCKEKQVQQREKPIKLTKNSAELLKLKTMAVQSDAELYMYYAIHCLRKAVDLFQKTNPTPFEDELVNTLLSATEKLEETLESITQ